MVHFNSEFDTKIVEKNIFLRAFGMVLQKTHEVQRISQSLPDIKKEVTKSSRPIVLEPKKDILDAENSVSNTFIKNGNGILQTGIQNQHESLPQIKLQDLSKNTKDLSLSVKEERITFQKFKEIKAKLFPKHVFSKSFLNESIFAHDKEPAFIPHLPLVD